MQNAPSPVSLIHINKPYYCYHLLQKSNSDAGTNDQDAVDFSFLCSTGKNPGISKSPFDSANALSDKSADLGMAAYELSTVPENYGDSKTALHFYESLAKTGNADAMNRIGRFYLEEYGSLSIERDEGIRRAIRWHLRAIRCGSKEGYKYLAECFRQVNRKLENGFCLLKSYQFSNSVVYIDLLNKFIADKDENLCKKLTEICKRKGYDSNNISNWQLNNVMTNFRAFYNKDYTLPAFPKIDVNYADTLFDFDKAKKEQIQYLNLAADAKVNKGKKGFIRRQLYPSFNKTQLFLMLMEAASPDFGKRDLLLANQIIKVIYQKNPHGLFECKLWIQKCESKSSDDIVRCGFVSCLLQDYDFALGLFNKASLKGNLVGSLLVGLILLHTVNNIKKEDGMYFLSKCNIDPLALIHLGLYCNNRSYLERAAFYLNSDPDSPEMYEWAGDMLSNGLKFPTLCAAATMLYSHAITKAVEQGEEHSKLMRKLIHAHQSAMFKTAICN